MIVAVALAAALPQAAPPAPPPAQAEALDPARLAAARALIDVVMPPEIRDGMIDGMLKPMMANLQQGVMTNPAFEKSVAGNPKLRGVIDRFLARQTNATLAKLRAGLPSMFAAMERAYARRFTIEQMNDSRAFFMTPSGRAYMREGLTIMSDPDVQAWQRSLAQSTMGSLQTEMATLFADLEAAETAK